MFFSTGDGLPRSCAEGLYAPAPALPDVQAQHEAAPEPMPRSSWHNFYVSACTANVASLYNGEFGRAGKTDYLRQQMMDLGLNFLGVQESRAPEIFSSAAGVLRIGSGSSAGQFGTELWVNLKVPVAWTGKKAHYLKATDFQVLHKDPRVLFVQVASPILRMKILIGHAPHSGHPLHDRCNWWEGFTRLANQKQKDERLLVLVDANADPGPQDDWTVFGAGFKTPANTHLFGDFLTATELCLPATGPHHIGAQHTWTSPNGLHHHCIDHIAIPFESWHECTYSATLEAFDLGNGCWDHTAVAVQLQWQAKTVTPARKSRSWCPKYDKHRLQRDHVQQALASFCHSTWTQNVEDHVADFNTALLHGVAQRCPQPEQQPKKPFYTSAIWTLRNQKLNRRKALKEITKRRIHELLLTCFKSMCPLGSKNYDFVQFWRYDTWLLCGRVRAYVAFHQVAHKLRVFLRQAKQGHLQTTLQGLAPTAPAATIMRSKACLAPPMPKRCTSPHCHISRKRTAVTVKILRRREMNGLSRIEFFRTMEGGDRVDIEQQRREWIQHLFDFSQSSHELTLQDLPSLTSLEAVYRRVHSAKATGPDGVDALLCHTDPASFARKTYSILLKTFVHGQESLLHKGGRLHPLWKCKGPKDSCQSYRSILISSHVGKSIHRCLRTHTTDIFEKYLQKQQLGGKRRIPVNLGVQQARAFLRSRKAMGLNVCLVFLDLCEAFYRIVRELAIGGEIYDETIAKMGQRLNLGADLLHELHRHLDKDSAIAQAGMGPHLQMVVRALHADTHFHLLGQTDSCRTRLGTRPGDCWADFIFSFLWARLLKELESELTPMNILDEIPCEQRFRSSRLSPVQDEQEHSVMPYLGPTWMDDSCFCLSAPSPIALERKASHLCGLLLQRCRTYAMTPNLAPGKTAVLFVFQGPGAKTARKKFFGPSAAAGLPILLEDGLQVVQVVSYLHLGSLVHHRGDMRLEARRRFCIAQSAFQQHRKVLYQNRHLPLKRRAELLRTLVLSKFVYGCESWTLMDKHTKHFVHTSLMKLYRRLLPAAHKVHYSDEEVLSLTGLCDPSDLFRQQRLRHLGALHACSDSVPWGVINDDEEWTDLIVSDLDWMFCQLRHASSLQDPRQHLDAWIYLMKYHRTYWKKLVRRAGDHAAAQRDNLFEVTAFHRRILSRLHDCDALALAPPFEVKTFQKETHGCMTCARRFSTKGGCSAHMFKAHPVRRLFDTTYCGCCLREFHSFGRLKAHLIRADFCRHSLQRRGHYVAPAGGIGSSLNEMQEKHLDGLLPPLQAEGPKLPEGARALEVPYNLAFFEEVYMRFLDAQDESEGETAIRELCGSIAISWEDFQSTLLAILQEASSEDIAVLPMGERAFNQLLRRLSCSTAWPFLCDEVDVGEGHWHRSFEVLERYCLDAAESV